MNGLPRWASGVGWPVCLGLMTMVGLAGPAQADTLDAIFATVDKEVILRSDIMREIGPFLDDLRQTAASEADFSRQAQARLRAALDQAVENKILLREALLAGLEVSDEQVEARVEEIRKPYASQEAFLQVLEEFGETMSDFRTHVRKQILAISMGMRKRRQLEQEAVVSEAEVARYHEANSDRFTRPERVRVRRLFLAAGQDAQGRAVAKARLDALRDELNQGADFAALAEAYSEGPEAEEGGLMGWVVRGDLVGTLEEAVFALAQGETSAVAETEFGFHLLKAEQKETAGIPSLEEVRTEIEPELRAQYAEKRYAKWIAELRKQSRVRIFLQPG